MRARKSREGDPRERRERDLSEEESRNEKEGDCKPTSLQQQQYKCVSVRVICLISVPSIQKSHPRQQQVTEEKERKTSATLIRVQSLMAFLEIKVIFLASIVGLISATFSPPSPQLQRQILDKWYREFQEISSSFDKDVLEKFAQDKGFQRKTAGAAVPVTLASTSTTSSSSTRKPAPTAMTKAAGIEREDESLALMPASRVSIGPVRIRYIMRTGSYPWTQAAAVDEPASGSVKRDNPLGHAIEDLGMSRFLRRLIDPEDGSEDDDGADSYASDHQEPQRTPFSFSSPERQPPVFKDDSVDWLSQLFGDQSEPRLATSSSSSTTSTTTTTTTTTSTTTTAPTPAADLPKTWNPFTKQGFRRIFRFAF